MLTNIILTSSGQRPPILDMESIVMILTSKCDMPSTEGRDREIGEVCKCEKIKIKKWTTLNSDVVRSTTHMLIKRLIQT